MNNYVYELEGKLYINLTNLCTNNCVFCIRDIKDDVVGANLFLDSEKLDVCEVKKQLDNMSPQNYKEIVFCGYGEPILKLEELKQVAQYIKEKYPHLKTRINTNGQGNLIYKRNIVPELKGIIDSVSISFNGENKEVYDEISLPKIENAYQGMKDFIKECVKAKIETTATIVTGYKDYKVDLGSCKRQIEELGAKFRERPWLDNGY
ncbi:MAG: TatD family nuclease-associated radical SAM protein [Clostridium sp.]|nr:TatD family nuclease-associated radical SAM protein [Clostridium sp.]